MVVGWTNISKHLGFGQDNGEDIEEKMVDNLVVIQNQKVFFNFCVP